MVVKVIGKISPVFLAVASAASILSLAFIEAIPFPAKVVCAVVALFCFIVCLLREYLQSQSNSIVCHTDQEIKSAMKDIIKMQGKICIMSRDLSWVDDDMEECILSKKDSMLIFAENENGIAQKLQNSGVTVHYYGKLDFQPKTRFTIVRYNRNNPQVAIANTENRIRRKQKLHHIIYQTSDKGSLEDQWITALALDMVNLCTAACKRVKNEKDSTQIS